MNLYIKILLTCFWSVCVGVGGTLKVWEDLCINLGGGGNKVGMRSLGASFKGEVGKKWKVGK